MHEFPDDFYGAILSVCVAGYIRPERKFGSLGESHSCQSNNSLRLG